MIIRPPFVLSLLASASLLAVPAVAAENPREAAPAASDISARSAVAANEPSANSTGRAKTEWNDPEDMALVTRAFEIWLDAVIGKDRATVESFHDEGFRAGAGGDLLDKKGHVDVEMIVGNQEMRLVELHATRRVGDILLVWSTHFIRADPVPEIPELGLLGDWGGAEAAKQGFEQGEISVWKFENGKLKCLAFAGNRKPPVAAGELK